MKISAIILTLLTAVLFTGCVTETGGGSGDIVKIGDPVPQFSVTNADGNGTTEFSQADFVGKRSMILFFRTVCPDCQREFPKIFAAWSALKDTPDFQLIAISREETAQTVASYWNSVDDNKPSFEGMPYYLDPDAIAFCSFAEKTVPRLYLVGTDGKIQYIGIEDFDFADGTELVNLIDGLQ
jgi:cytochrome oxidase Cu insertion factor (SCO1/SenC/PrrC family)